VRRLERARRRLTRTLWLTAFDWGDENEDEKFGLGCSGKDCNYQASFGDYFYGNDNYVTAPMFKMVDDLSATDFREALRNGESIAKFLPDGIDEQSVLALFNNI
tara:strand:+ start:133 stop:444 length:312 start_codon:yes stop_codon:yes gene_type:complete